MDIYITEVTNGENVKYEGPHIQAESWVDAEDQAEELRVSVIGILESPEPT